MTILSPRTRTLGVRLSEDEYSALEKFCIESGARSISDFARTAICVFINHADRQTALASTLNQNVAQVKELEQRIEALTAQIELLKSAAKGDDGRPVEAAADAGSSEQEASRHKPGYDPGV